MGQIKSRKEEFILTPIATNTAVLAFKYKKPGQAETAILGEGHVTKFEVLRSGDSPTISPLKYNFQGNIQTHIMVFDMGIVEHVAQLKADGKSVPTEMAHEYSAWNVFLQHPQINVMGYEEEQGSKQGQYVFQAYNKTRADRKTSERLVRYAASVVRALSMDKDKMVSLAYMQGQALTELKSMNADQVFVHLFGMENKGYYYQHPERFSKDVDNPEFEQLSVAGQAIALGIVKPDPHGYFLIDGKPAGRFQTDIVAYWRENPDSFTAINRLVAERLPELAHTIGTDWTAKEIAQSSGTFLKPLASTGQPEMEKASKLLASRRKFLTDEKSSFGLKPEDLVSEEAMLVTIEKLALSNIEKEKSLKATKR